MKEEVIVICSFLLIIIVAGIFYVDGTAKNKEACLNKCGKMKSLYEHGSRERSKCYCVDDGGEHHLVIIF